MSRQSIGELPMTDAEARRAVALLGPLEHRQFGHGDP